MQIVVLMGKSLSGKTYLEQYLFTHHLFNRLTTSTTRPKRTGEQDGRDYYFLNTKQYECAVKHDLLIAPRDYKVANGQTWHYFLDKSTLNHAQIENPQAKYALILDLKGYLELEEFAQNAPNLQVSGVYLDVPLNTRLTHYLNTSRNKENEKEFVRRLYDDEFHAFNELDDPAFAIKHHVHTFESTDQAINYLTEEF